MSATGKFVSALPIRLCHGWFIGFANTSHGIFKEPAGQKSLRRENSSLLNRFFSAMGGSCVSLTPPAEFLKNPASNLTLLMNKAHLQRANVAAEDEIWAFAFNLKRKRSYACSSFLRVQHLENFEFLQFKW
ncbi:hypothetical protein CDAR_118191 [Caerostris darwini]|uniref:LAGLIDADG homing endonuclease n=1 Tax=Caerostris darwini TaxID=1538125 RepID=A0AAV4TGW8_9ARAC|nr:hypothetical protein CDAR_118191 [Caerostris darwini]